jgi:hypothetical protein
MLSRSISILIGAWLPMLAAVLPIGPLHTTNAVICGTIATLLSFAALADDRARIGMAIVGAWVALSVFIFRSTLIEQVLAVSWGVTTFVHLIGPFSDAPRVTVTRIPDSHTPPREEEPELARAA